MHYFTKYLIPNILSFVYEYTIWKLYFSYDIQMFTATITNNSILLAQRCTIRREICLNIRSLFNGKNVSGLAYRVYVIVVLVNTRIITSQQLFFSRPCGLYRRLLFGKSRNVPVMVSKATTIAVQNTRDLCTIIASS